MVLYDVTHPPGRGGGAQESVREAARGYVVAFRASTS